MNRKRLLLVLLLVIALAATLPAQTSLPWFGTHHQPGNIAFSATISPLFGGGIGLAAYPGAEYIFAKWRPLNLFSLDFGFGARGAVSFWNSATSPSYGYLSVGGAPVLTIHGGMRGFPERRAAQYIDRFDFFSELGLGFQLVIPGGNWPTAPTSGLTIMNVSGLNFYFTESLALSLSSTVVSPIGGGWSGEFGAGIGITYKIGPAEEVGERITFDIPDVTMMTGEVMYTTFSALYWASISLGGYLPSDETFEVGDGIRFWHRYESVEDDDVNEMEFVRALLHEQGDGSQWWRFEFYLEEEDEEFAFEALVRADESVELIRYEDPGTEEIVTHEPSDGDLWRTYRDEDFWTSEDLEEMRTGSERIRVPAGSFQTERLETSEDGATFVWWVTDDVPGRVVRFEGVTEDDDQLEGELLEILSNVRSPWGRAW